MDKDFQIALLKELAPTYPGMALKKWDALLAMAHGDSPDEKKQKLVRNLAALEEFGYIQDFSRLSADGRLSVNCAFRITVQGLVEAGENILCPDPYRDLRRALLEQAECLRALSADQKKTLKKVLASLPHVALQRLQEKGLDMLLGLLL